MADMEDTTRQTPSDIYKAILRTLKTDTKRINLVKRDQELILQGWEIYFALDPYDIAEFCFPFSTNMLESLRLPKIEEISRLQNGRWEAIYNVTNRPVLLQRYEKELNDTLDWASWSKFVVTESEILDDYLRELHIKTDADPDETKDVLADLNDNDISSLIAVVTGIISIGFRRLSEIAHKLSLRGSLDDDPKKRLFLRERKNVVDLIIKTFEKYFEKQRPGGNTKARGEDSALRSHKSIEDNNRRDAQAVDQLLQLNEIYNKHQKIILYFSSAPKSLYLDESEEVKKYYPHIDGKPYELVRTATDLFVYMVYKGDSQNTIDRTERAKKRLDQLGRTIATIQELGDAFEDASRGCEHCNINPKAPRCEYGVLCETIKEYGQEIKEKQNLNVNYSLQKRLAAVLEKTANASTPARYKELLQTIKEIQDEADSSRAKDQEMEATVLSLINRVHLVSKIVGAVNREENRKVSCYLNTYPVFLATKGEQFQQIVKKVIHLFHYGWADDAFKQYVDEYLKLRKQLPDDHEGELVGCFLNLIMGQTPQARRQAEKYLTNEKISDDLRREFRYVLCFVLWAAGNHKKAIEVAGEGMRLFPHDGRFPHCRSVIMLSLLDSQPKEEKGSYKPVVEDTEDAIRKFSRALDLPMSNHRLGVCYNNLAYYLSERDFNLVDVNAAEAHLLKLKEEIPEDDWDPAFPEFFHTKGCVLYSKFLESPAPLNRVFLDEAFKAAQKALILFPIKEEHNELVRTIINTYERFKIPEPVADDFQMK